MNSVVSRWLHEEVPGVRDVPRQGRSGGGVGGRQVDLPFLVPHPAWEVPVRSGHADLHPGYQIHMLNSSLIKATQVNKLEFQSTCCFPSQTQGLQSMAKSSTIHVVSTATDSIYT